METPLEHALISLYKIDQVKYLNFHPEYFDETIKLAISDKQPYAWRAAMLLWASLEKDDKRLENYLEEIIKALNSRSDGHQRELIKILLLTELNEEHEGYVYEICTKLWQSNKEPSVRCTAFKFILKTAKKHPDLKNEILFLTQDQYLDTLSPGAKKSVLKLVKSIIS
jgi:hypothetical protein